MSDYLLFFSNILLGFLLIFIFGRLLLSKKYSRKYLNDLYSREKKIATWGGLSLMYLEGDYWLKKIGAEKTYRLVKFILAPLFLIIGLFLFITQIIFYHY